jgi:hypothetical protein
MGGLDKTRYINTVVCFDICGRETWLSDVTHSFVAVLRVYFLFEE